MGKIIIVESSTDGCGKETQTKTLVERLKKEGKKVIRFTFPNYENYSSIFVKKYLNGEYGKDAKSQDPYIVSTFFAIDRYITFKEQIERYYNDDYYIIIDRYVISNMIYQGAKIQDKEEKEKFLKWEEEFEYNLYKIPRPDKVIYLHLPVEESQKLIANRKNKIDGNEEKDIHEQDLGFLKDAYNMAEELAHKNDWIRIECIDENKNMRTIEDISDEIYNNVIGE